LLFTLPKEQTVLLKEQSVKVVSNSDKVEGVEALKTLLKSQDISLSIDRAEVGQQGQGQTDKNHDLKNSASSLNQQKMGGCRLVWFRTLAFQANDPGFKSRRPHFYALQRP
jgi:hypothetical protein